MDDRANKFPIAWQPLTPGGAAAFAGASFQRLFLFQLLVALLAAATVVWLICQTWFPVIERAINRLPAQSEIRYGKLAWPDESPIRLAENTFLAISVDLSQTGATRSLGHFQLEFTRTSLRIFSLFGFYQYPYPRDYRIAFSRPELQPWWGAWSPVMAAGCGVAMIIFLLLTWFLLATLYTVPVWLLGFFANRALTLQGSWQLSCGALMAGGIFLTTAILFYSFAILDLVQLTIAWPIHILIGWFYAIAGLFSLPRHPQAPPLKGNPFTPKSADKQLETPQRKD